MKVETQDQQLNKQHPPYFLWEQHNITLYKSPNCGYGLAISGGCNTNSPDSSVYVSDVVAGGPAENKLLPNDIILTVNGVNVENVEHEFVIRLLKEAKDFIHLVVKRKAVNSVEQPQQPQQANSVESQKYRQNLAIQQTAATVMANYVNSYQNGANHTPNSINPINNMINSATSMSSLKPFKLTFTRKDKKEPYGVILGCKYYVKEIVPNSVASLETSLKLGDVVLKVNDFDVEHISLLDANRILTKTKENKIHLVIKRNSVTGSIESDEVDSATSPNGVHSSSQNYQNMNEGDTENHHTPPVALPAPPLPPSLPPSQSSSSAMMKQLFKHIKQDNTANDKMFPAMNPAEIRTVVFTRENSIGVRLAGGNRVGIFICDVQYNSRAERAGLRQADKILRVNGVDYSQLTREEAVKHILNLSNLIEMVVVNARDEYESRALDPIGGDSFFVRTHFNYGSSDNTQLSFKINDVLHVTDTLHNGVIGQWVATRLNTKSFLSSGEDQTNFEEEMRGTVPNHENAEQLISAAPTIDQQIAIENNPSGENGPTSNNSTNGQNGFTSLGASARMSIRKRLAGKNGTLAKRSRSASRVNGLEIEHNSNIKVSKANTYLSNKFSAYERVVHREVNFPRPIVIFGPLADVAREKLKSELPDRFEIPESFSANPNDNQQSTGVIKLASIKAIIEKGKHSLLDITPNAVDHLNYAQYFPIVVYLKAQSRAHTKELRQKYAKNLRAKSSRRLYDNSNKLETFYSHLFTAVLSLDSNQWFKKLKETIESQQSQIVWISEDLDKFLTQNEKLEEEQREQEKQQQQNHQQTILNQPNNMYNHDLIFNDNFEFQTMQPFGTLGAVGPGASSTYSLYEDSNNYNRSSFAASDSDIGTIGTSNMMSPHPQQQMTSIYSTNFKTKNVNNEPLSRPQNGPPPLPSSHKVNSDPNLLGHQDDSNGVVFYNGNGQDSFTPNSIMSQQMKQRILNSYEVNNVSRQSNQFNDMNPTLDNPNTHSDNSWKKFATYSANSLRHLTSKLLNNNSSQQDQLSDSEMSRKKPALSHNGVVSISAPSSVVKSNRQFIMNGGHQDQLDNYQQQSMVYCKEGGIPTSKSDYYVNTGEEQQNMRNSSLSNYIMLKNSQFQQQPQPIMTKQISTGSLLLPTNLVQSSEPRLESRMSELKLTNNNDLYANHQITHAKSNNSIGMSSSSNSNSMGMKRKKETSSSTSTFSNKPPPTLPKPKFILPQSSTTNMILQRNLKAKSELNIATTPSTFASTSSSSSSSASTTSSNSPDIKNEPTLPNQSGTSQQKRSVSQQPPPLPPPPTGLVQSIRNKFLENSSVVSSSQGYHSDAWESSQSSRQSFDMLMDNSTHQKRSVGSKTMVESKLAKNTILNNKNTMTTNSASHDGLVSSSSEDNESMPISSDPSVINSQPNLHHHHMHQYYNVQTKTIMIQKPTSTVGASQLFQLPTTSSSSTVSTTSSSGGAGSSSSGSSSSSSSTNCFNNNHSPNNHVNNLMNNNKLVASGSTIELPIYYQPSSKLNNDSSFSDATNNNNVPTSSSNRYSDLYSNEAVKFKVNTYAAHYNDNGVYRKLMLDSNSNCSIIASANGIFDSNGGILESADTGVSLNVPEGAIAPGCNFDLYFKVCHCKSNLTNSKGEPLTNPIVMCGPRGIKFMKPVELQIPHFISLDGKSWSYAFKTSENITEDDPYSWTRFYKRTLINSVTVMLDSF